MLGAVVAAAAVVSGPLGGAAVAAAAVVGALSLVLPHHAWPAVLLVVTMAAPGAALPLPGNGSGNGAVSPSLLVLMAWVVLEMRQRWCGAPRRTVHPAVLATVAALSAWLVVGTITSTARLTSASWTLNLLLLGMAPLLLTGPRGARLLVRAWVVLAAVLGAYALVEGLVLHANPVWGWAGAPGGARASVSSSTPLTAALFFAPSLVLALAGWLRDRRAGSAACALLVAGGLAASGARGALLACAAGLLVVLAPTLLRVRGALRLPVVVALVLVVLGTGVAAVGLAQRDRAGDADGSFLVHARSASTGLLLAREAGWRGFGPGTAYTVKTQTPGPAGDEDRSIENAWLELSVASGLVGAVLLATTVVVAVLLALRRRRWGPAGALVALSADLVTFNALEGARPTSMVLLGLLLASCAVPPTTSGTGDRELAPGRSVGPPPPSPPPGAALAGSQPPALAAGPPRWPDPADGSGRQGASTP